MDAKRIKDTQRRLTSEYERLVKSINRNRTATEEMKLENTEDEGDLATLSHDREMLSDECPKPCAMAAELDKTLLWLTITPLGADVEPEVYCK